LKPDDYFYFFTPIVVVVASYLFGIATSSYERKMKAYKERYDNLYIPFMNWLVHYPLSWINPRKYTIRERQAFIKLLLDNSQFMGKKSSKLLIDFYNAHLDLDEFDIRKNQNYFKSPAEYEEQFYLMANALLEESTQVSAKLKLPDMPATISAMYNRRAGKL
jgi:hypothetical protein